MVKRLVLGLLCAWSITLSVTPGLASAEEPTGFRDLPWGTEGAAVTRHVFGCTGNIRPMNARTSLCLATDVDLGDARAQSTLLFVIETDITIKDHLAGYILTVRRTEYSVLRDASIAKFGKPTKTETRTYQSNAGAMLPGEVLRWSWPSGVTSMLMERCGRTDKACLQVETPELHRAYEEVSRTRRSTKPPF